MRAGSGRIFGLAVAGLLVAASCTSTSTLPASPRANLTAGSTPAVSPLATLTPGACNADPTAGLADQHWWDDRVFYEVFVRSFADSNGDGIGDLKGLIKKLDYLNDGNPATNDDLGVTGLWLMPIIESPSYHGYDIVDYRTVARDYGTNDDFKALVTAAHQRGIAVIIDLVLNHTSSQHPWFIDSQVPGSAHDAWYEWSTTDPGWTGPGGRTVWFQSGSRWYYAFFSPGMPDLNLSNPAVTSELDDIARFWLGTMGVDGFRLDAAQHLVEVGKAWAGTPATHQWLRDFRTFVRGVKPDPLLAGEISNDTRSVATYGPDQVDLAFEFTLADAMLGSARRGGIADLPAAQALALACHGGGAYAAFLSNHDQDRVMSRMDGDRSRAQAAAALLLTNPGLPFIYYGEEIGLQGQGTDELRRAPMPWTASGPEYGFTSGQPWEAFTGDPQSANVEVESADPTSLLNTYRRLIRLREAYPALQRGSFLPVTASDAGLYAFVRSTAGDTLLVLINLSGRVITDYGLDLAVGPLAPGSVAADVYGERGVTRPTVTSSGGFSGYRPVSPLEPGESIVVSFGAN